VPLAVDEATPFARFDALELDEIAPIQTLRPLHLGVFVANPWELEERGLPAVTGAALLRDLLTSLARHTRAARVTVTVRAGISDLPDERAADLAAADVLTDVGGAQELLEIEASAVEHMNTDHALALRLYAVELLGAPDGAWQCVGIDPDGLDLQLGSEGLRLAFPQRINAAGDLRTVLKDLAEQTRAKR
jgi:hypothetical protein